LYLIICSPFRPIAFNPLNTELDPICHLLALLGAHHILHISRIRVNDKMILNDELSRMLKQSWLISKHSQRVCLGEEQCGKFRPNFENWTHKILINNPKTYTLIEMKVLRRVVPCNLLGIYQYFSGRSVLLILPSTLKCRQQFHPKYFYPSMTHGFTFQTP
jgi:hypothetical protein